MRQPGIVSPHPSSQRDEEHAQQNEYVDSPVCLIRYRRLREGRHSARVEGVAALGGCLSARR